jgi:ArsR family transcriptional regulator
MKATQEMRAKIFKALGHPSRLAVVDELARGERCVCELQRLVGSDMSTVSKHLSILRETGIVAIEKRGTNIYYSLKMTCVTKFMSCVHTFLRDEVQERVAALRQA